MLNILLQLNDVNVNVKDRYGCTSLMNVCLHGMYLADGTFRLEQVSKVFPCFEMLVEHPDIDLNCKK